MIRTLALFSFAGIAFAVAAGAAELAAPDPRLTPGAIISNDRETACTFRATPRLYQTNRSVYFEQARQVFERCGIPYDQHREYELDHLIPRCLGGTDSVLNEWPEPLAEATIKDAEEARICRAVCSEQTMTLEAGRQFFTTGASGDITSDLTSPARRHSAPPPRLPTPQSRHAGPHRRAATEPRVQSQPPQSTALFVARQRRARGCRVPRRTSLYARASINCLIVPSMLRGRS